MSGRHSSGVDLANGTEASDQAHRRLRAMLETLSGQKKIADACEELGISEAQFHKLRHRMMAGALASLEPGVAGRPSIETARTDELVMEMQEEIRQLRIELRASQIREEVALLMPHLVKVPEVGEKKRNRKARSGEGKGGTHDKSGGCAS